MASMMVKMFFLGVASAAYQGGGDQTYDTGDDHLGHGGPGGNGSEGMSRTGIFVFIGIFFAVLLALAAWCVHYSADKSEQKPLPELEMTVGADLEEGVEPQEVQSAEKVALANGEPLAAAM